MRASSAVSSITIGAMRSLLRSGAVAVAAALTIALGQRTALPIRLVHPAASTATRRRRRRTGRRSRCRTTAGHVGGRIVGQLTGERPTEAQILMVAEQTPSEVNPGTRSTSPTTAVSRSGICPPCSSTRHRTGAQRYVRTRRDRPERPRAVPRRRPQGHRVRQLCDRRRNQRSADRGRPLRRGYRRRYRTRTSCTSTIPPPTRRNEISIPAFRRPGHLERFDHRHRRSLTPGAAPTIRLGGLVGRFRG